MAAKKASFFSAAAAPAPAASKAAAPQPQPQAYKPVTGPPPVAKKEEKKAPAPAAADADGYSDEEFDNYGDDGFDEIDPAEVDEPPKAVPKPAPAAVVPPPATKPAAAAVAKPVAATTTTAATTAAPAPVVVPRPLFGAKPAQRNDAKSIEDRKFASAQHARVKRIMPQLSLVEESFVFLEIADQSADEFRARAFKLSLLKNAGTQCEHPEVGMQTDPIETNNAIAQSPDDLLRDRASAARAALAGYNSKRLIAFLSNAAPVLEAVALENAGGLAAYADAAAGDGGDAKSGLLPFASHQISLTLPPLFGRRAIIDIQFSARRAGQLLVAYGKPTDRKAPPKSDSKSDAKAAASTASATGQMPANFLDGKGVLAVWDLNNPKRPNKILYCDGTPSCCAFATDRSHIAFAGLAEGSVAVWDMREQTPFLAQTISAASAPSDDASTSSGAGGGDSRVYSIRNASFTTDNLLGDNHQSTVLKIASLVSSARTGDDAAGADLTAARNGSGAGAGANGSAAFQLVSLDEDGIAIVWTAIELADGDAAGSSDDFGLAIGARVKLIKSSILQSTDTPNADAAAAADDSDSKSGKQKLSRSSSVDAGADPSLAAARIFDVQFRPDDSNEYLSARGTGVISRASRFGKAPLTVLYDAASANDLSAFDAGAGSDEKSVSKPPKSRTATASVDPCVSVVFSPFFPTVFLAGYLSGTIALFELESGAAAWTWPHACAGGVRTLCWSPVRPTVFFAFDAARTVHVFDLTKTTQGAVSSAPVASSGEFIAVSARSAGSNASISQTGLFAFGSSRQPSTVEVQIIQPASASADADRKRLLEIVQPR